MRETLTPFRTPSTTLRLVAFLALGLAAAGCKSNPAAPADDATLTQSVKSKIAADTSLTSEPIQASVQQGVATLNGTVSSDAARSLAANDAAQVAGIRTVVNNLTVQAASLTPPPPAPKPRSEAPASRPAHSRKPSPTIAPEPAPQPEPPPTPQTQPQPAPIEHKYPAPPANPAPVNRSITLPADTTLPVRITQTLDSSTTQQGDTFTGVLASDVVSSDGTTVLPQGTAVSGRVVAVQEAAHFKGNSLLSIELTSLDRHGDRLPITTDTYSKAGNGRGKNTAEKIGGGAAVGAILGGIFGGGKGAAIGAAAGGGAGTAVQGATRGQQVQIPSETLVRFRLANPVTVRVGSAGESRNSESGDLQRHNQ